SRRRHTRFSRDWSSDVCSSDLLSSFQPLGRLVSKAGYHVLDDRGHLVFGREAGLNDPLDQVPADVSGVPRVHGDDVRGRRRTAGTVHDGRGDRVPVLLPEPYRVERGTHVPPYRGVEVVPVRYQWYQSRNPGTGTGTKPVELSHVRTS